MISWLKFLIALITNLILCVILYIIANAWQTLDQSSLAAVAITSYVQAGLFEELAKVICWVPWTFTSEFISKTGWRDRRCLYQSLLAGVIFGILENIDKISEINLAFNLDMGSSDSIYNFITLGFGSPEMMVALIRFVWGPLMHAIFTVIGCIVALLLGKDGDKIRQAVSVLAGLIVAAIFHGTYDIFVLIRTAENPMGWAYHSAVGVYLVSLVLAVAGVMIIWKREACKCDNVCV